MLPILPRIELAPISPPTAGNNETEEEQKNRQTTVLRYVLRLGDGAGGGGGGDNTDGMPSEVFFQMLKMVGPSYYPVAEGAGSDGKV
jgi:hypothetical protein